jgi:hypothetical protein
LDIQLAKVDRFDQMQSGLAIQDALNTLEERALDRFFTIVSNYIHSSRGMISFSFAAKAASDFVTQLYGPVFGRVDPEEVGARTRSMRIASDYGQRLSVKSQNLKPDTLRLLAETYSSHSFVIDQQEAEGLFNRVRETTDEERSVIVALDRLARFQTPLDPIIHALHNLGAVDVGETGKETKGHADARDHDKPGRSEEANGRDSAEAASPPNVATSSSRVGTGHSKRGRARGTAPH